MNDSKKRSNHSLMTEGSILLAIKQIALPMLLMMITAVTFSNIDARYISLLGKEALNGFNVLFPFLTLSSAMIYGGLGTGVSAMVARSFAKGDHDGRERTIRIGLYIVTFVCSLFAIIFCVAGPKIFAGLTENPLAQKAANQYSLIYFSTIFFMGWGAVFASGLRGTGNAMRPAKYSIFVMLLNLITTPLFAFDHFSVFGLFKMSGLNWGVNGAAIASVLSSFILCLLLARDLFSDNPSLWEKLFQWNFEKILVKKILGISLVAMLMPMMNSLLTAFVIRILHFRGDAFVDSFSLSKRFELALIMLIVSLGNGVMVVVSANHAIDNNQRVRETINSGLKILFAIFIPLLVFMAFASFVWFRIFTDVPETLREGAVYFLWASPGILFSSAIILLNFGFQGLTLPQKPLPYTITSIVLFQGAGALILKNQDISTSSYYALTSVSSFICFLFVYRLFIKQLTPKEARE